MAEAPAGWYAATPIRPGEPERADRPEATAGQTLSRKQKRELGSLTVAGVASAVFFLVPLLNGNQPQAPLSASDVFTQIAFAPSAPVAAVPASPSERVARPRPLPRMLESRRLASVITSTSASITSANVPGETGAFRRTPGAVARVLFGDGRYRVQPFPRVEQPN